MIVELEQKRRHPRMECAGEASLHVLGGSAEFRGRILDLSLNGCLITLDEAPGLKPDVSAELSFSVNRLPFRVCAQVKVMRSQTTIGFQFLNMSRRGMEQLAELIEELGEDRLRHMPGSKHKAGGSGIEVRPLKSAHALST